MSQHDMEITTSDANTGITFRAAINAALQALASLNNGTGDPSITYPYQLKVNTASNPITLLIRNAANNTWVQAGHFDANGKLIIDTGYGVVNVTADYTATLNDEVIFVNAAGAVTITLPTANGNAGKEFIVKKIDSSANAVTIDPNGSETIDGQAAVVISGQNDTITVISDGANWREKRALNATNATNAGLRDTSRGLIAKNNGTNATYQVDIDADEMILQDSSGVPYRATSVNLTADITVSGVNGLDTGSEAASTWYYIWVIYNGTTVASLLSTSATAPTMPSGYTHKALVGAIYNGATGDFYATYQQKNEVRCEAISPITVTETSLTLKTLNIPINVKKIVFIVETQSFANAHDRRVHPSLNVSNHYYFTNYSGSDAFGSQTAQGTCFIETPQTIYAAVSVSGNTMRLYVKGWEY